METDTCQGLPGGLDETSIDIKCYIRLCCNARGTAEGMSQPSYEVLQGITNGLCTAQATCINTIEAVQGD
jgi:hypothetical protein